MQTPISILTVEDEASVRMALIAYLEDLDYRVIESSSGAEALQLCRQSLPDLVLCDLRMPGMDGLELLSELQRLAPELPVIIVSGANRMDDAIQALKRGAWDYVTKPILDMEILDRAVRRALERVRLVRENRDYQQHLEQLNRKLKWALEQLQEDEQAARMLQSGMLPANRGAIGPWRFRQQIYTAAYLSGDFVDYFPLDEYCCGFYMADVSGHGAASAMVTAMLQALFEKYRQQQRQKGSDARWSPAETLSCLNQDLCRLLDDKYLTIFYGVLDSRRNRLLYSSGGQFPYPLLLEGTMLQQPLDQHDQPVGLFEEAAYRDFQVTLGETPGLLLLSDGILELLNDNGTEGRMKVLVGRLQAADFDIDALIEQLGIPQRQALPDDIAFLTIHRERADG